MHAAAACSSDSTMPLSQIVAAERRQRRQQQRRKQQRRQLTTPLPPTSPRPPSATWRPLTVALNSIGRRGVGTREQRRRWWVQRLETLSTHVPSLCDTLAPCCVDTVWLVWCSHVDCAWHLLWRTHFNSIWRGVSFGCDPPPFGWSPVAPGSRPYLFGMIVGVASDR